MTSSAEPLQYTSPRCSITMVSQYRAARFRSWMLARVPMPLISYGGTAAVSLLAGFGLVMAARSYNPVHGGHG